MGGSSVEIQPREGTKRRRFKSWMNWRRMFQRKAGNPAQGPADEAQAAAASKGYSSRSARLAGAFSLAGATRSRSISELLSSAAPATQPVPISSAEASGAGDGFLGAGLSVSHDSVFGLDASPPGSYPNQQRHQESLPSSASLQYMSELRAAIGIRRRSADEDEGFPRSPVNVSPPQILSNTSLHHTPVHAGSGSDPSLLSLNSCDSEEVFPSLPARSPAPQQHLGNAARVEDDGLPGIPAASLNHSAAKHKISVRPKRNHAPARVRQLPQLAEDTGIAEDASDELERKPRALHSTQQHFKPRSVSLSRTEDSSIKEAPLEAGQNAGSKPSAGSSTTKLARSKSSVEKKIQHEVAVFWRKTKEGRLFQRKENSNDKEPSQQSTGPAPAPASSEPEIKRKELRKIKRDKEEKRKRSETTKDEASPPFLSRIFGSRRSGRRLNNSKKPSVVGEAPPSTTLAAQVEPVHPLPKPRTVFSASTQNDDNDMDVDWRLPHQPYSFAPPPSKVLPPVHQPEEWVEEEHVSSSAPSVSPRLPNRHEEVSPPPPRHRIHIAGLSPYQRRVARIGNGLEISDEEWDQSSPVQPRRLDSANHSNLSLENSSLPVHINHDFILKKASPAQDTGLGVSENIRRSFDILKFSNEGLKKTIDSLNNQRLSQSSDQLHLSDGSLRRESTGSRSNSTSSLNISDADDLADIDGSAISLGHSSGYEKDVRDDVLIIDDHKETIEATVWPRELTIESLNPSDSIKTPSPVMKSGSSSPKAHKSGSSSPITTKFNNVETPSSQGVPEFLQIQLNPVIGDSQQQKERAATETPMFSMSVRVQNPPETRFRRSSSGEAAHPSLPTDSIVAAPSNEPPKPFIASVRMRTEEDRAAAAATHQLMARLSARPWQSKEDKERQNKVLLDRSQSETADGSASDEVDTAPDVKLRAKKPAEETSELLKVFARRSLKLRDSRDLTDAVDAEATGTDGSISVRPSDEPFEAPKERVSSRWKPPIAARESVPHPSERMLRKPSKSVPFIRVQESHASLEHPDQRHSASSQSPPVADAEWHANGSPTSPGSKNSSPTGAQVGKFFEDRVRSEAGEDVWKKQPPLKSRFERPSQSQSVKAEEAKPTPAVRQSKVLDMVHNFQRLQVT